MSEHGTRHRPAAEGEELVGAVSLDDSRGHANGTVQVPHRVPPERPAPGAAAGPITFRGPYSDGPPPSALVVDTPPLSRFGLTELRRMAVVGLVLQLSILKAILRVLLRPSRAHLAAAASKGLVDGF